MLTFKGLSMYKHEQHIIFNSILHEWTTAHDNRNLCNLPSTGGNLNLCLTVDELILILRRKLQPHDTREVSQIIFISSRLCRKGWDRRTSVNIWITLNAFHTLNTVILFFLLFQLQHNQTLTSYSSDQ